MVRKYRLSRKADTGLTKIWRDIAVENIVAADELYHRIVRKIELAAERPGIWFAEAGTWSGSENSD